MPAAEPSSNNARTVASRCCPGKTHHAYRTTARTYILAALSFRVTHAVQRTHPGSPSVRTQEPTAPARVRKRATRSQSDARLPTADGEGERAKLAGRVKCSDSHILAVHGRIDGRAIVSPRSPRESAMRGWDDRGDLQNVNDVPIIATRRGAASRVRPVLSDCIALDGISIIDDKPSLAIMLDAILVVGPASRVFVEVRIAVASSPSDLCCPLAALTAIPLHQVLVEAGKPLYELVRLLGEERGPQPECSLGCGLFPESAPGNTADARCL